MRRSILVVDDERALADTLRQILVHAGYNVVCVYNPVDAIQVLQAIPIDLLISDVIMPGMDGVELAIHTRRNHPCTDILLISGNTATEQILKDANGEGSVFELLAKPVFPSEMLVQVACMLERSDSRCKAATA